MSHVIAGVYEIQEQIGAGGGGIVYLGRHIRLNKKVVLKADKRTLNTKTEVLRREVDLLKGLSHTYIPQVYDFVQEDGVVYTVMDYIEGESLDKVLKRDGAVPQPEVIRWACQLLEALCYLHNSPPHGILHGDIKPANIMLRPNGDICLIDFNIALALGENGAVKVGFSRGYASPEHYGIDYERARLNALEKKKARKAEREKSLESAETELEDGLAETEIMSEFSQKPSSSVGSSTSGGSSAPLDVRSDIYSLGATLYHLISGTRAVPEDFITEPLGKEICSQEISAIIYKAMQREKPDRYQTAADMLKAFKDLYKNDIRTIRHKRRIVVAASMLSTLFLAGGACTFVGLKQMEQRQNALTLAEYSSNSLAEGDIGKAVELAMQAISTGKSILEAPITAEARKALTDALGVYNLADGFQSFGTVALSSAPFQLVMSPGGKRFAAVQQSEVLVFDTETRSKITALETQNSALSEVIFVDDSTILYAGIQGITAYDIDLDKVLWQGRIATTLSLSADHTAVAAVNRDETSAVIYSVEDGTELTECLFEGKHLSVPVNDIFANAGDNIFSLNRDGSLLAVSFSDGGIRIFNLKNPEDDMILYDDSEYTHFEGAFCGKYFAFVSDKSDVSQFGLIDTEEAVYMGGYDSRDPFALEANEEGIYLSKGNLLVRFDPDTLEETELAYADENQITGFSIGKEYVMTATDQPGFSFYDSGAHRMSAENSKEPCDFVAMAGSYAVVGNRNEPSVRIMKLESHDEAQLLSYDARYDHDEARLSQDGRTAMFFSYQNFRIYDMAGTVLNETEIPDPEHIYDQQFRKTDAGSWLEIVWYDGTVRNYSAADGSLREEKTGEAPAKDLYEEFYVDRYRFVSELHSAPKVYDIKTGKQIATLEKDSYLTYVTQVNNYIVTEYVSAAGERYGLLLDDKLQTLAYLPKLCDISGDKLVFDYKSGNLRQCRLYSLQELETLGESYHK